MTVWEIAKRANVSIATVSRVINGVGNVDPSLARRVRRVVAEVGYYPNTHARALVSGRSRTLGLVLDIINPFFFGDLADIYRIRFRSRLPNSFKPLDP